MTRQNMDYPIQSDALNGALATVGKSSLVARLLAPVLNTANQESWLEFLRLELDPLWSKREIKAQVVAVVDEPGECRSLWLKPNALWTRHRAGQHVDVTLEIDGRVLSRCFSISSSPAVFRQTGLIRLTIKKIDDGVVTPWIHSHHVVNKVVTLSKPRGEFEVQDEDHPVVFVAAGSGITPVAANIDALLQRGVKESIQLLYIVPARESAPLLSELEVLAEENENFRILLWETQKRGRPVEKDYKQFLRDVCKSYSPGKVEGQTQPHCYTCGPRELVRNLQGVIDQDFPDMTLVSEFFQPPQLEVDEAGIQSAARKIQFLNSDKDIVAEKSDSPQSLLQLAESAGLRPKHGCRMGICHSCKCRKNSGVVINSVTGERSASGEEDIQLCVSYPVSDVELSI